MKNSGLMRHAFARLTLFCLGCLGLTGAHAGGVFTVNTTTAGDRRAPDIATDSAGNYVIVWQGPDGDGLGIFGRRFAADGTPLGQEFAVNTTTAGNQEAANVAIDASGRFAISYTSTSSNGSRSLQARRYSAAGVPTDLLSRRVPVSFATHRLALAADGTALFVGINEGSSAPVRTPATTRLRRFSFDGVALGQEVVLDEVDNFFRRPPPGVCIRADGSFAVAYSRVSAGSDITLKRYAANGQLSGSTDFGFMSDGTGDAVRVACLPGGDYVTSYTRSDLGEFLHANTIINRFSSGGSALDEFVVDTTVYLPGMGNTANSYAADLAAYSSGGFAAIWTHFVITSGDDENPESFETRLYGRRYSATGSPVSTIIRIDSPSLPSRASSPALALSDRSSVASWFEGEETPSGALTNLQIIGRQLP